MRDTIVGTAVILAISALPNCAEAAEVTPGLVCSVQNAIRFRESAWTPARCEAVAAAFNATPNPALMLAIATNESDLRPGSIAHARPGIADVGLMGVRCRLERGRCTNGPAQGLTMKQLQDPETNIFVAAQILASKGGDLRAYNGGVDNGHGYAGKIRALTMALAGVKVKVKGARMRKLIGQIVAAVAIVPGRQSAPFASERREKRGLK